MKLCFLNLNAQKALTFIALICCFTRVFGQNSDTLKHKPNFELSFGQSILYISSSKQATLRSQSSIIVPTNAILMFIEMRPHKNLRVPVFLNLPTESKQYLVNGQIVNERASPTLGSGTIFKLYNKQIDSRSKIEIEAGPLISILLNKNNSLRVAPILACRIRLMRGENFVMYAGCSYSIGINALGLLYGTGTIF
jgi:hypothetical protein